MPTAGCLGPPSGEGVQSAEPAALTEGRRLGGLDGPIHETFGSIGMIHPARDGGFLVVDDQVPALHRYAEDGRWIQSIGRVGKGPGEFEDVAGLGTTDEGVVVVYDQSLGRLTVFDRHGDAQETWTLRSQSRGRNFNVGPDGVIWAMVRPERARAREGPHGSFVGDWARIEPGGETERRHAVPPEDRTGPEFATLSGAAVVLPFNTMTLNTFGVGGHYWEMRNDYREITHRHPDGAESAIVLAGEAQRLLPEELAQWEAKADVIARRPTGSRWELFPIPRTKPLVRSLTTDSDGRLWVQRYTRAIEVPYSAAEAARRQERGLAPLTWLDRNVWEVYDRSDNLLGVLELPPRAAFQGARGEHVYAIELGPYGEAYAVKYRAEALSR